MNTIIAPVDFSGASANALSFAAEIAKRTGSLLIVVNILGKDETEAAAASKLKESVSGLKTFFGADLKCETLVEQGSLVSALEKVIESRTPSLVVMGTKGASGLKRVLIGSNTVNVLAKTKVPVFVIPEVARFEDFIKKGKSRVVLATDLEELQNGNALDILKEIALLIIEPKVRVVNVRPKGTHLDHLTQMERNALLSIFSPEIEAERATVFSSNVMSGINFYLNEHSDTGMVAMIARDSGDLVQRHYTREMASHTQFPLLVLHDV